MSGDRVDTDRILPVLEEFKMVTETVEVSQSFEEKTIKMKIAVQVPEKIDWNAFYKKIGGLKDIIKLTLNTKL